ncbi:MAG: tetratricopeptide repeat protein, partial [Spirochaetota bacterium]
MPERDFDATLQQAYQSIRLGDFETAERLAKQLLAAHDTDARTHVLLGSIRTAQGRMGDAESAFRRALGLERRNVEALNNLGVLYRQKGDLTRATKALEYAARLRPDRADIHYNMGNVHKVAGNEDRARESYERAVAADPDFAQAHNNLGTLYQQIGDHESARNALLRGLKNDPNHPSLRYNLGVSYEALGDLEQAEEQYRHASRSRPGWTAPLRSLAGIYQKRQDYAQAEHTYKEILRLNGTDAQARTNLGILRVRAGDLDDGIDTLRQVVQDSPSYEAAAVHLADLLAGRPGAEGAVDELYSLARMHPRRHSIHFSLSSALVAHARYKDAESVLNDVLDEEPDNLDALRCLGEVYMHEGRDELAGECFARIRKLDPDRYDFEKSAARILLGKGRPGEAEERIRPVYESHPDDVDVGVVLGETLFAQQRLDEARVLLEEIRATTSSASALALLARVRRAMGDPDGAVSAAHDLVSL